LKALRVFLAIKNGIIPPTINFEHADDQLDQKLDYTFNTAKKRNRASGTCRIRSASEATMLPSCFARLVKPNFFSAVGLLEIEAVCGD